VPRGACQLRRPRSASLKRSHVRGCLQWTIPFCRNCGARLESPLVPSCGASLLTDDAYCRKCGRPVTQGVSSPNNLNYRAAIPRMVTMGAEMEQALTANCTAKIGRCRHNSVKSTRRKRIGLRRSREIRRDLRRVFVTRDTDIGRKARFQGLQRFEDFVGLEPGADLRDQGHEKP